MIGQALRKAATIWNPPAGFNVGGASRVSTTGMTITPDRATTAQAVYSAVTLIAETIGSIPFHFVKRGDETRTPIKPPAVAPLWPLGDGPNVAQTVQNWIESYVLSMLLWGNAYGFPRWHNAGNAYEIWILDPGRVRRVDFDQTEPEIGVLYEIEGMDPITVRRSDRRRPLIHFKAATKPGMLSGMSPVAEMANLIGISLTSEKHAGRLLGNGVRLGGVLEIPGSPSIEVAREIRDGFVADHSGTEGSGTIGVLTGGAKFNTLMMPPAELQFLEQLQLTDRKLAAIYRVPPHMIGDVERSTSWGAGIEEQAIQFVRHTLMPLITKLERGIESTLLAGQDVQMRFDLEALLRGDAASTGEFLKTLFSLGAITRNEIRALRDLPPADDPDADSFYVPANYLRVGDVPGLTAAEREAITRSIRGAAPAATGGR